MCIELFTCVSPHARDASNLASRYVCIVENNVNVAQKGSCKNQVSSMYLFVNHWLR